jgi:hypothetical protein
MRAATYLRTSVLPSYGTKVLASYGGTEVSSSIFEGTEVRKYFRKYLRSYSTKVRKDTGITSWGWRSGPARLPN